MEALAATWLGSGVFGLAPAYRSPPCVPRRPVPGKRDVWWWRSFQVPTWTHLVRSAIACSTTSGRCGPPPRRTSKSARGTETQQGGGDLQQCHDPWLRRRRLFRHADICRADRHPGLRPQALSTGPQPPPRGWVGDCSDCAACPCVVGVAWDIGRSVWSAIGHIFGQLDNANERKLKGTREHVCLYASASLLSCVLVSVNVRIAKL